MTYNDYSGGSKKKCMLEGLLDDFGKETRSSFEVAKLVICGGPQRLELGRRHIQVEDLKEEV